MYITLITFHLDKEAQQGLSDINIITTILLGTQSASVTGVEHQVENRYNMCRQVNCLQH